MGEVAGAPGTQGAQHITQEAGRRRRRWPWVAAAVLVLAGLGAGAAVVVAGDDAGGSGEDAEAAGEGAEAGDARQAAAPTTTTTEPSTPERAFARARLQLDEGREFTYTGTARSASGSVVRPGIWLAGDLVVEGEVSLPDRTHEVAVAASGEAVETATEGVTAWGREAGGRDGLAEQGYEVIAEAVDGSFGVEWGLGLLPLWLGAATDRRDGEPDLLGRRTLRGTVPADRFGVDDDGRALGPAELVLTVDEAGTPVRVEVTTAVPDPPLHVAVDLAGIGGPVVGSLPGGGEPTSVTGPVTAEDARAAGIAAPVELARVPAGWALVRMELTPTMPRPGCTALQLDYQDTAEPADRYLGLNVTSAECAIDDEPFPDPLAAGPFSGTADLGDRGGVAQVTDGTTAVNVHSRLPAADMARLLETLAPFDPATPPEPTLTLAGS